MSKITSQTIRHRFGAGRALSIIDLMCFACLATSPGAGASEQAASALPAGKQTTLGLYVSSSEAYDKWKTAPETIKILDVRTPEEYMFIGHANMAWNIPVATQSYQWSAEKKQFPMSPLEDFVTRVKTVAGEDDTLLVTCRSGGRSAMAVNMLAKAGFKNVYNITDGFEGDKVKDPNSIFNGQPMVNGWKNSGLPWTYHLDPALMVLPATGKPPR